MTKWLQNPILKVDHLSMRFGGLIAVNELSFSVGRGDITALIGPNGAGKTTVFNCITGFYKPTSGRLTLAHNQLSDSRIDALTGSSQRMDPVIQPDLFLLERMSDHQIAARARVARTFQNIRLFPGMTVLENLIVAQHKTLMRASAYGVLGLIGHSSYVKAETEAIERARHWLQTVNLIDRADDLAGALPYGDQRRLEIARAMCTDPVLLCLDEPAAGLNNRESAELTALLRAIRNETGVSILLIEHDMSVVMDISDHVIVIEYGIKIADNTADSVKNDPKVIAAYLGVEDDEMDTANSEAKS